MLVSVLAPTNSNNVMIFHIVPRKFRQQHIRVMLLLRTQGVQILLSLNSANIVLTLLRVLWVKDVTVLLIMTGCWSFLFFWLITRCSSLEDISDNDDDCWSPDLNQLSCGVARVGTCELSSPDPGINSEKFLNSAWSLLLMFVEQLSLERSFEIVNSGNRPIRKRPPVLQLHLQLWIPSFLFIIRITLSLKSTEVYSTLVKS